mgnify:CR=1 FL=1
MVELVSLFWILLGLAILIFLGKFFANSMHILLYVLIVVLMAVFFFNVSLTDIIQVAKKLLVTYL